MFHFTGIHHLALATGDMEATVRFWRDLLGLPLVYGDGRPGYRQYFFAVSEHALIAFFEWPGVSPLPRRTHGTPVAGPFAFDHVALEVPDEAALWAVVERLAGAGFPVSDVVDHGYVRSVYAHDPNGIPVEFACPVAGHEVRKHPLMADSDPVPAAREGVEPRPDYWPRPQPLAEDERVVLRGEGWENFAESGT